MKKALSSRDVPEQDMVHEEKLDIQGMFDLLGLGSDEARAQFKAENFGQLLTEQSPQFFFRIESNTYDLGDTEDA